MGWRKIRETGEAGQGVEMYEGDAPAEILEGPVAGLLRELEEKAGKRLHAQYLISLIENFLNGRIQGETAAHRHLARPFEEVRKEYRKEWGRDPYLEELLAVVRSVLRAAQ